MKQFTPETKKILDKAIEFAPARQVFMFAIWGMFYPHKIEKLIEYLKQGMSWRFAYEKAKSIKQYV